jgi:hypothetical protein
MRILLLVLLVCTDQDDLGLAFALGLGLFWRGCLFELAILAPAALVCVVTALLFKIADDGRPALFAVVQRVEPLGKKAARNLAVLVERARRLGFDDDAGREVFELDSRGRFVLERRRVRGEEV